jgi:hypothetical protein
MSSKFTDPYQDAKIFNSHVMGLKDLENNTLGNKLGGDVNSIPPQYRQDYINKNPKQDYINKNPKQDYINKNSKQDYINRNSKQDYINRNSQKDEIPFDWIGHERKLYMKDIVNNSIEKK